MRRAIGNLLWTLLLRARTGAWAQTAPAGGPTQVEARRALEVLEDPQKRAQLIDTLRAIAKAPPPAPEAAAQPPLALEPNSLGAQLLSQLSGWSDRLAAEPTVAADAPSDLPPPLRPLGAPATDPR